MKSQKTEKLQHIGDTAWCNCSCHTKGTKWNKEHFCKRCYSKQKTDKWEKKVIKHGLNCAGSERRGWCWKCRQLPVLPLNIKNNKNMKKTDKWYCPHCSRIIKNDRAKTLQEIKRKVWKLRSYQFTIESWKNQYIKRDDIINIFTRR